MLYTEFINKVSPVSPVLAERVGVYMHENMQVQNGMHRYAPGCLHYLFSLCS